MAASCAPANSSRPKQQVANPYVKKKTSSTATSNHTATKSSKLLNSCASKSNSNNAGTLSAGGSHRERKQTQKQKEEQVRKFRQTMQRKKEAKAAQIEKEKRKKEEEKKRRFFDPRTLPIRQANARSSDADVVQVATAPAAADDDLPADIDGINDAAEDEEIEINEPTLKRFDPGDVTANLDYDEEEDANGLNESDECPNEGSGVQQRYVEAIQKRIQEEVHKDFSGNSWLIQLLNENDWWIRKAHANNMVKKLKLRKEYDAYYRDVYVWLPDVRWKDIMKTYMPCCPNCKTNAHVEPHCFRDNHAGRVVVGLKETYYLVSRRYICHECKQTAGLAKAHVENFAKERGLNVTVGDDDRNYTWMGWDKRILPLFSNGHGEYFPAFLTWRAGVDKVLIDLMRPLFFDGGFRPERFADLLLELHSKEFTKKCIQHEHDIVAKKISLNNAAEILPLSNFADKRKYRGLVPTAKYLAKVYKKYHSTIGPYMDMEVKKRGAEFLHWDVSYKEAKHLCLYRGRPVFKGLVTAMNELGEVRIQFHVYTDSHEQMKSALEAFKGTTRSLGLPEVRLFFTDNPAGDHQFYTKMLPSLVVHQEKLDAICVRDQKEHDIDASHLPFYPSSRYKLRKYSSSPVINNVARALLEDVKNARIGLDAEWNATVNRLGMQTGRSKVQTIQIAYRNSKDELIVFVLVVGKLRRLPPRLESLLMNDTISIFGKNVSSDLTYIARDFNIVEMKDVDQKTRQNDGGASLGLISERTLKFALDKSLQCSDWTDLTQDKLEYAATDAAVSLECAEVLIALPDLTRRLQPEEIMPGIKVDLLPRNGTTACMATRAATARIANVKTCKCPHGSSYGKKKHKQLRAGKRSYIVEIEKTYSPALVLPGYHRDDSGDVLTLADVPRGHRIVVPISMIKEHVHSDAIRPTPIEPSRNDAAHRSMPAEDTEPIEKRSRKRPKVSSEEGYDFVNLTGYTDDPDDEAEAGFVSYCNYEDEEGLETVTKELTSEDIEYLQSAIFDAENALSGKAVLESKFLSKAPDPTKIKNKFRTVLGDVFHAMDRSKVPVRHEAKKAFFVALRDAFFVWNPPKLKDLEGRMRENGLSNDQIRLQRYFNTQLFRGCVDRKVPEPRILYWRVRAVYITFGSIVDSKTKSPLFNDKAWKKADNVLKEILQGFYSDPPGFELYNKKLRADGTVKTNQYGMEMIECSRGTNRTECYHKNITVTFGTWSTGVEMSDCLLRERRHRHNHNTSQHRRLGYPRIGHCDTWLVDLYQNLARKNHGLQIYSGWTNTSDYKFTEENFDTVPLHTQSLHNALGSRYESLDKTGIKLTQDQQYLASAMGTPLPFLPFSGEAEYKAYARFVVDNENLHDNEASAIEWCKLVDGKEILPKLPSHLRTHREEWDRNQRVKESEVKSADKTALLAELCAKITPVCEDSDNKASTLHNTGQNPQLSTDVQSLSQSEEIPYNNMSHTSRQNASGANLLQHQTMASFPWNTIVPGPMFSYPPPQALTHNFRSMIVGGIAIGVCGVDAPLPIPRRGKAGRKPGGPKVSRSCRRCKAFDGANKHSCRGRTMHGQASCEYFNSDGTAKPKL
ncbi:hypothetical protein ACHAWF_010011 [Thalassiosira exigua]